ncbi:MAG TPA: GtrA family protein, partial [Kineosporiaceae bacterium]|nr:GtrA family protein [Kineosporiaceae bacterium]
YVLLRPTAGAQLANALALLLTAVANTAANRRFTFGARGRDKAVRHQAEGLMVFVIGLGVSSGSLALLHAVLPRPATAAELAALVAANLLATVIRFVMLKSWVFHPGRRGGAVDLHVPAIEGTAS